MADDVTDITYIGLTAYFAAIDSPRTREATRLLYECVEQAIQNGIKKTARGPDFCPLDISVDWEQVEMRVTAAVDLRLKFVRDGDGVKITEMSLHD